MVSTEENIFEITAEAHEDSLSEAQNAKLAQEIAQKMIDIFREENLSGGRGELTETLTFVNGQLAQREKELESAEQRRQVFEAQNPDMVAGGAGGVQRLEAARTELRGQLAGTPATLPGAPGTGGPKNSLAQAQTDLANMRARGLTDNHPDVISVKNQIAALRAAAQGDNGNLGGVPNPAYSSLQSIKADREASVQSLQARRAMIQGDVAQLTSRQINDPQIAAEAQRIGRDYDVLRQQYDKLLRDREELRLRGQVKTEREAVKFEVVDPPTTPRAPVAPNRPVLLLGVLIVGVGAGVGAAFALGQLRGSFSTTTKLEKAIGLPVLGSISRTLTEAAQAARQRQLKLFLAGAGVLGGVFILLMAVEFIQRGMVA
jgi:polysaccharide chain length determinant protein (PEP-CTERM system associated)